MTLNHTPWRHLVSLATCFGLLLTLCPLLSQAAEAPIGKATDNKIYAQRLVDEMKSRNPDLLAIALHAVRPDSKDQAVIASTQDKIGEVDPQEQVDLVKHSATMILPRVEDGVNQYLVLTPLKDGFGRILGLVVISHRRDGHKGEAEEVLARQYRLGVEIAKLVGNDDFLYQPYDHPMGKAADNKIYAEKLVLAVRAKHPELIAVGLHASPPGTDAQQIIANNIDNINSMDPPFEIDMTRRGVTTITPGMHDGVKRYQVISPLKDSSGQIIGLIFINYPRKTDGQELELLKLQDAITDDLAKQIPNLDALFQPAEI